MRKGGASVNQDRVNTLDEWLLYYKLKYVNIVRDDDGSFLVLNPVEAAQDMTEARKNAKRIAYDRGSDYSTVLANDRAAPGLRAAAEAASKAHMDAIAAKAAVALTEFETAERELLDAVNAWKIENTTASRTAAAMHVGVLSKQVEAAEANLQNARYPHRYIVQETTLARKALNYATRDDRAVPYPVYRIVPETTATTDRVLSAMQIPSSAEPIAPAPSFLESVASIASIVITGTEPVAAPVAEPSAAPVAEPVAAPVAEPLMVATLSPEPSVSADPNVVAGAEHNAVTQAEHNAVVAAEEPKTIILH